MNPKIDIRTILFTAPVIPVVVIEKLTDAVPLARALVAGGLRVIEITLRTPQALDAIRLIRQMVPEAIIGAGTVLRPADFADAAQAGAVFAVSPGATTKLLDAAEWHQLPLLPGIATASEAMRLIELGYRFAKFFPAQAAGGSAFLSSIASPLPQLTFCPTGGITLESSSDYLRLPNVACIGGSWMVGRATIAAGDWAAITAGAARAAALNAHRQ